MRRTLVPITKEEIEGALKTALREWLDEQFARIGRWTIGGVLSIILVGAVYIIVTYGSKKL
jgi:hypothetical protein